ncbi:MAG: ankyrin repeat domain-containing protein [Candidatus Accumulibacter sp.]|uniref:ankyrin repeat domain-containing protein n=1 Tax=Accumulibacter sp. TaxID=2053492 RepID=UPI002588FE76|nr:ankyrin repeat domain-containing protein [Accumulibacter sp.]MCM8623984.1 ankyrin repeat domain-containing protein [Accumulibacter sp.]
MSTLPLTEAILLEIHQSLGCPGYRTIEKERFASAQDSFAAHKAMFEEILRGIFDALDMDPLACLDAIENLQSMADAYKSVELSTWTFDADERQILWTLLGYFFIPGLARHAAFWNLDSPLDQGMPGGRFWYLPEFQETDGNRSLYLPVAQVVDWLLDLLGMPLEKVADARSEATDGVHEGLRRSLYNWRSGTTIHKGSIEKYFKDQTELSFHGAFVPNDNLSPAEQFDQALVFVVRKNLTAEKLRTEIPMTRAGRLEAILDRTADDDEQSAFVGLLAVRYGIPSMHTIRQRLLFARMVQDGYSRLLKFVCPGVDRLCADAQQNKLLQLFGIYKQVYNLTMDAWCHCRGEGETAENAWFEDHLPPWDKQGLFLSILPSRKESANLELAMVITRLFSEMQAGAELEDHVGYDDASAMVVIKRNANRAVRLAEDLTAEVELIERLKGSWSWSQLQNERSFWVLSQAVQSQEIKPLARQAAIQRLRDLAATPSEAVQAMLFELDSLLNGNREQRPQDARDRVQALLDEVEANDGRGLWEAAILQYRAKHLLACNDFKGAEIFFRKSLDASSERNYGRLRGEAARDCLATAVANQKLIPEHHERYYKEMLAGGMVEGIEIPGIEDAAGWASQYFWDTLYVPYPGTERIAPMAQEQAKQIIGLVMAGNLERLRAWVTDNRKQLKKSLPLVTGDSVLMLVVKFKANAPQLLHRQTFAGGIPAIELSARYDVLLKRWREAVMLLCQLLPQQLNLVDFKGQTPLMLVAEAGETELVSTMLKAGADPDRQDWRGITALHTAIKSHVAGCVDTLLDHPCQLDKTTSDGRSMLHTAALTANIHAVKRLLLLAPDLAWQRNTNGMTPLELVEALIEEPEALSVLAEEIGLNGGRCPQKVELIKVVELLE